MFAFDYYLSVIVGECIRFGGGCEQIGACICFVGVNPQLTKAASTCYLCLWRHSSLFYLRSLVTFVLQYWKSSPIQLSDLFQTSCSISSILSCSFYCFMQYCLYSPTFQMFYLVALSLTRKYYILGGRSSLCIYPCKSPSHYKL